VSSNIKSEVEKTIKFELKELDSLFSLYKNELLELEREANLVELTAMASVLHSFYSGVEKILLVVAKKIDENVPGHTHFDQWSALAHNNRWLCGVTQIIPCQTQVIQ
jgi:hypothetical protein